MQQSPSLLSAQVGNYIIEAPLGEGAVAVVYRAQPVQERDASPPADAVALKILKPHATQQPRVLACFQFESRVLARLAHPGILRVYDAGVDDGRLYTAMELIDGVGLDHHLLAQKRLDEPVAADIIMQMARALDYLHGYDYVHRDIKPANIMLGYDGRAVLFDFGTVIRISDGADYEVGLYGTPGFLAPEQITPESRIDGRADLYALGVILYLMTTGRKPFYGSRSEVLDAHVHEPPPPPERFARLSPDMETIILKALAKDPADRFQSGAAFAQALDAAQLLPPRPPKVPWPQRILSWLQPAR